MRFKLAISAIALALSACGGGGDSTDAVSSAEGFWSSTDFGLLVTGTGEVWAVEIDSPYYILYKGTSTTSGSSFNAQISAYAGSQSFSGTASGTATAKSTLTGTATAQGQSSSFSLRYVSSYDLAPSLANVAGNYSVSSGGTVAISIAGGFTGSVNGCAVSGTVTPDSSGKNFYRLAVTFGAAPCALPGVTASGVVAAASATQLVGGVSANGLGDAFVLTKQ